MEESPASSMAGFPENFARAWSSIEKGHQTRTKRTRPITQILLMTPAAWVKSLERQGDYRGLRSEWEGKSDFLAEVCGALCTENWGKWGEN